MSDEDVYPPIPASAHPQRDHPYDAQVLLMLGGIDGSVKAIHKRLDKMDLESTERDKRIGKVERKQSWYAGAAAAIGAAFGLIGTKLFGLPWNGSS